MSRLLLIFANFVIAIAWFGIACDNYEKLKWDRMLISLYLCFVSTASMYYIWRY